jgi:hypothetical protein
MSVGKLEAGEATMIMELYDRCFNKGNYIKKFKA